MKYVVLLLVTANFLFAGFAEDAIKAIGVPIGSSISDVQSKYPNLKNNPSENKVSGLVSITFCDLQFNWLSAKYNTDGKIYQMMLLPKSKAVGYLVKFYNNAIRIYGEPDNEHEGGCYWYSKGCGELLIGEKCLWGIFISDMKRSEE